MTVSRSLLVPLTVAVIAIVVGMFAVADRPASAQSPYNLEDYRNTMIRMVGEVALFNRGGGDTAIFEAIRRSGDTLYIAPLLDVSYFVRGSQNDLAFAIFDALRDLTGQDFRQDWQAYFGWASENDIELPPHYAEFKGAAFAAFVDPEFGRFFRPGSHENANVNMLEAVWGGVIVDGIPSLVNARQITPEEALAEGQANSQFCRNRDCSYPATDELVFGVSFNGDSRAYPLRLLNWHEMFNDVIGSSPLLAAPDGEALCNFRAPVDFNVVERDGDAWVRGIGVSAGCPEEGGWLSVDTLTFDDGEWETVRDTIPDVADESPLATEDAVVARVDGRPVMLAYCTLCGSGILYDVTIPDLVVDGVSQGETVLEFGSTGLLMRSNKLMYDRNTDTVWNALTGVPAFGPLVESDIRLEILPVVVTDWASWLEQHPDTSVLSLDTGFRRTYANGAAYTDYFNDPDFIMFPVWQQDTTEQGAKDMVFALNIDDTPKAYPLELLIEQPVTNDTLAGTDVVIVSRATPDRDFFEPGGAAVRAYDADGLTFSAGDSDDVIVDEDGTEWTVTEEALVSEAGDTLPRLGGHLAFWFGWYSFHPETLVYEGAMSES